jgi:aryl-alcohol dehydrogenase-like predicted oxidoreductase
MVATVATRPIPKSKSGEELPIIGLGTARCFGKRGDDKAMADKTAVIKTLIGNGGKVIDTAAMYGAAEELVGEILEQTKLRPQAFVATKCHIPGKEGTATMERSFKALRTNTLDLLYIHNMVDVDTHLPTIEKFKSDGRVRYIGISDTSAGQDKLITWMDRLDFVEFAYSVGAREAEKRLLPAAKDKGVAVFTAIPLGRGSLLSAVKGKEVPAWAKEELQCETYAQLLLKFVVSHPAVTVAIPATSNPKHIAENLDAGRGPMPDAKQREKIAAIWKDA